MLGPGLLAFAAVLGQDLDAREAFDVARAMIGHQEALIGTFDVEYTIDIRVRSNPALSQDQGMHQQQSFREQRRGTLYHRRFDLILDTKRSAEAERDLQAFDGSAYRWFGEAQQAGSISSQGTEPTCITQTLYLSTSGLGETLQKHGDVAETRWDESTGHRLLAVTWDESEGAASRTYFLDPSAAFQPRRYTLENRYPEGYFPDGRQSGTLTGEVKEFLRQDGVVWPAVVELADDEVDARGKVFRYFTKVTRITSLRINPEFDDSLFTIDFPNGTTVIDKDRSVKYVVGQTGSDEPINSLAPDATSVAVAGPMYEAWADWRIWTAFSLLCLGLLYWIRRKGWA